MTEAVTVAPVEEGPGLSNGHFQVGAKVTPHLYGEMERVAKKLNMGLSDVIRRGVVLFLEAHGADVQEHIPQDFHTLAFQAVPRKLRPDAKAAIRMWRNPENRRIILEAVNLEARTPTRFQSGVGPPVLRNLRRHFGTLTALKDALVAETGVPA